MGDVVVVATGQSLSEEQVAHVRICHASGACLVVAVSDAYKRLPKADALVANDRNWWNNCDAEKTFAGRKFCGVPVHGMTHLQTNSVFHSGTNSGLQGMRVARDYLNASRILLLGIDMHGTHYFGPHPAPLRNTTEKRFAAHLEQFKKWTGTPVVNCSPGSALTLFPMGSIFEVLHSGREGSLVRIAS